MRECVTSAAGLNLWWFFLHLNFARNFHTVYWAATLLQVSRRCWGYRAEPQRQGFCTWVLGISWCSQQGVPKPPGTPPLSSGVHHKKSITQLSGKSGSPMISAWYSYKDMIDNLKLRQHSSVFHWDVNKTPAKCQLVNLSWITLVPHLFLTWGQILKVNSDSFQMRQTLTNV